MRQQQRVQQDNAISWFDWTPSPSRDETFRFVQQMIKFRKAHPALSRPTFYTGAPDARGRPDIAWHGTQLGSPGFDDPQGRVLACTIAGVDGTADLHVMMNMFWEPLDFEVPSRTSWRVAIDTSASPPNDIAIDNPALVTAACVVRARSIVVLESA
jgi:isoamylase